MFSTVRNSTKWSNMVQNGSQWSQTVSNSLKWFQIISNGQKWSQIIQNSFKWSKLDPKCLKWFRTFLNGSKWSEMFSNVLKKIPNCPNTSCGVLFFLVELVSIWSQCLSDLLELTPLSEEDLEEAEEVLSPSLASSSCWEVREDLRILSSLSCTLRSSARAWVGGRFGGRGWGGRENSFGWSIW